MTKTQNIIIQHKPCEGYWELHHKEHACYYHDIFCRRVSNNSGNLYELLKFLVRESKINYTDFLNTFEVKYVIN